MLVPEIARRRGFFVPLSSLEIWGCETGMTLGQSGNRFRPKQICQIRQTISEFGQARDCQTGSSGHEVDFRPADCDRGCRKLQQLARLIRSSRDAELCRHRPARPAASRTARSDRFRNTRVSPCGVTTGSVYFRVPPPAGPGTTPFSQQNGEVQFSMSPASETGSIAASRRTHPES